MLFYMVAISNSQLALLQCGFASSQASEFFIFLGAQPTLQIKPFLDIK